MSYLVKKPKHDARMITCGLWIPDGFYRVVEMTYGNVRQLDNLKAAGYLIEETDKAVGAYTDTHRPVDPKSLEKWIYKEGPVVFLDEQEPQLPESALAHERQVQRSMEHDELAELRAKLDEKGIKYRSDAKPATLKKKLQESEVA